MIPVLAVLAILFAWRWHVQRPGVWTPERQALYWTLLTKEKNPKVLEDAARRFAAYGFPTEAAALKARVSLPTMHGTSGIRGQVFRQALSSRRPEGVRDVAGEYERMGCGAAADNLKAYARGLEVLREARSQPGFGHSTPIPLQFLTPNGVNGGPAVPGAGFGLGTVIPSQYPVASPPPPDTNVQAPDPSAIPDDPSQWR